MKIEKLNTIIVDYERDYIESIVAARVSIISPASIYNLRSGQKGKRAFCPVLITDVSDRNKKVGEFLNDIRKLSFVSADGEMILQYLQDKNNPNVICLTDHNLGYSARKAIGTKYYIPAALAICLYGKDEIALNLMSLDSHGRKFTYLAFERV